MIVYPSEGRVGPIGILPKSREWLAACLASMPFQLIGAILIGGIVPVLLRSNFERFADTIASYDNSIIGTMVAVLFGFLTYRKISVLPGTRFLMRVLPSFLISYSLVLSVFLMSRLDYSRYQFAASFVLVTLWFAIIAMVVPRLQCWTIALIRTDRTGPMQDIRWIEWIPLSKPGDLPSRTTVPLAADFSDPSLTSEWEAIIAREVLNGRPVLNARTLHESLSGRVQIEHLSHNPFGHLSPDSVYGAAKRYIDLVFALLALVFLSPLLLVIAIAVRLDSAGPAIFRQVRIGYLGKPFTVYKFRSMRVHDGASRESDVTRSDDDRITAFGHFIRKTRLDELPQILNILKGEMSWIGPRPEAMRLSEWYTEQIPFYAYRHIVRPGITGWAQVQQGHVTSLADVREKLEYDFYYIKYFSIWIDLLIVAKTLKIMFTGYGAK